jgi:hypothetical protein
MSRQFLSVSPHTPRGGWYEVKGSPEFRKDNMGWSGWVEFRNLTPNDKTNLLTRAALSTGGRAKTKFLSASANYDRSRTAKPP